MVTTSSLMYISEKYRVGTSYMHMHACVHLTFARKEITSSIREQLYHRSVLHPIQLNAQKFAQWRVLHLLSMHFFQLNDDGKIWPFCIYSKGPFVHVFYVSFINSMTISYYILFIGPHDMNHDIIESEQELLLCFFHYDFLV